MNAIKIPFLLLLSIGMMLSCDESGVNDLPQLEPAVVEFKVTNPEAVGKVDHENGAILLQVPVYADIKNLVPDIHVSYGSTVTPSSGTAIDFTSPVTFTIRNGSRAKSYTVTVEAGALDTKSARILILGIEDNINSILNADEKTAASWALNTFDLAHYMSFNALKSNPDVLDEIDAVWWHFDRSYELPGGNFVLPDIAYDNAIVSALNVFRANGGGIYLSGFATQYLETLEVVPAGGGPDEQGGAPADFANPDNWGISFTGYKDHPIFTGLRTKVKQTEDDIDEDDVAFLISGGASRKDNKSWWVVIDEDFPYGIDLASTEWDKPHNVLVLLAEFPGTAEQGKVVAFSAGAYDWFSVSGENTFMDNIRKITENILIYSATPKE